MQSLLTDGPVFAKIALELFAHVLFFYFYYCSVFKNVHTETLFQ